MQSQSMQVLYIFFNQCVLLQLNVKIKLTKSVSMKTSQAHYLKKPIYMVQLHQDV